MKHIFALFAFLFLFLLLGQSQPYSIKNRWNSKLSLSVNRTNEISGRLQRDHLIAFRPRLNLRAECNYGVLNWLELGGYVGYIRHENIKPTQISSMRATFAPTFGINVNVHLLPFWVHNEDCRWELYVTAKYGGAYLINYLPSAQSVEHTWPTADGREDTSYFYAEPNENRYRHEFGVGIGGGVYFKNLVGLYFEAMVGQYSYFPELSTCYYNVRGGLTFKWYSKKKAKQRNQNILL